MKEKQSSKSKQGSCLHVYICYLTKHSKVKETKVNQNERPHPILREIIKSCFKKNLLESSSQKASSQISCKFCGSIPR